VGELKDGGLLRAEAIWRRQNVIADVDLQGQVQGEAYLNVVMLELAAKAVDEKVRSATG